MPTSPRFNGLSPKGETLPSGERCRRKATERGEGTSSRYALTASTSASPYDIAGGFPEDL